MLDPHRGQGRVRQPLPAGRAAADLHRLRVFRVPISAGFALAAIGATLIWTSLLFGVSLHVGRLIMDHLGTWRWVGMAGFRVDADAGRTPGGPAAGGAVSHGSRWPQPAALANERIVSPFEFWPGWLFYASVVAAVDRRWACATAISACPPPPTPPSNSAACAARARPDPRPGRAREAPGHGSRPTPRAASPGDDPAQILQAQDFGWPLVVKPDIGCNGTGVRLVQDWAGCSPPSPRSRPACG